MLLRSASTPVLNSWFPHSSKDSSPEPDILPLIPRTSSISLSASSLSPFSCSSREDSIQKMTRALSASDLRELAVAKKRPFGRTLNGISLEEEEVEEETSTSSLWSEECEVGGGIGGGGGKIFGGGGGGSDGGDSSNNGNDSIDAYYQRMIEINPGNALLLGNYARFLKEIRGNFERAEEYCARAILASPNDGEVLSMYGDLVWQTHKDPVRAETYFDRAVKASPDDCYVIASNARFLWDAEEEKVEAMKEASQPCYFNGAHFPPPLAATS
ncbi:PsbD mRNA maturation factor Nac2 chloroplastic [Tripterygium wilfordii]|uniref:PsbD mRNA maturation factor Nac2 chloroplastic n=1 Tax=Tripterygium wilfordii TaxID=458696 RepID=A0A7J7DTC4_TRIWF|nr:uncharacterized protein LOC119996165 [Tripterygium wilfordii]KAF5749615.1 PsbD mRNA maturation factor Nac2 chloroplastic [Tripterygium wilfordii]